MDDVLWVSFEKFTIRDDKSLNPCYDGWCSLRINKYSIMEATYNCLNPCYDGWCSLRIPKGLQYYKYEAS